MKIDNWLRQSFGAKISNNEANFPCPKCKHKSFYFNITKKVGVCFRAGCGWTPTLNELQEYLNAGHLQLEDALKWNVVTNKIIELPQNSIPIISCINEKEIKYNDREALEYLLSRGVNPLQIFLYKIHSSYDRVILPVYDNGVLVSYVARHFRGNPSNYKYLYPEGARHSETFLNWIEAKTWPRITLVENSFVSLWLRDLFVTTNFGSSIGESQIGKLVSSYAKSLVLLWDEGAEAKAEKVIYKLRRLGIPCCRVQIKGQPDKYSKQVLSDIIDDAHISALAGNFVLDKRKVSNG